LFLIKKNCPTLEKLSIDECSWNYSNVYEQCVDTDGTLDFLIILYTKLKIAWNVLLCKIICTLDQSKIKW